MTAADLPDVERESRERLRNAMMLGSDISGATVGAVSGFLMGGPVGAGVGAAAGSFLGHSLRAVGSEVCKRYLSPREEKRVGAVVAAAAAAMQERVVRGEQPRDDDFFIAKPNDRSSFEEVCEGVLVAAQREHEEKKIPFIGRLLSSIAFDKNVDRFQSNYLIAKADELSFRAFCIIFISVGIDKSRLRKEDYRRAERPFRIDLVSVMTEITSLCQQGLMQQGGEVVLGLTDIQPANLAPIGVGAELYNRMELHRLVGQPDDWLPLVRLLGPRAPTSPAIS